MILVHPIKVHSLSSLPARCSRCLPRSYFFHTLGYAAQDIPSTRTVSKKKYSELPTHHISAHSELSVTQANWTGGLHDEKDALYGNKPANRLSLSETTQGELSDTPSPIGGIATRKRQTRRVARVTVTDDGPASASEGDDANRKPQPGMDRVAEDKPRRRRKTKVPTESLEETPTHQPRNQLAIEILENLNKFPHCILLTRVGQFYESYFNPAEEVARLLNIKLTSRMWDGHRIHMCGFPIIHLQKYLKVLVQQNLRFVALCEEFPRPSNFGAKPVFDRRVVRVVTPGTLIDEAFLNHYENNYLLSVTSGADEANADGQSTPIGLAWIDVSTGEFFTRSTTVDSLRDELVRIGPREVVLHALLKEKQSHPISAAIVEEACFASYIEPSNTHSPLSAPNIPDGVLDASNLAISHPILSPHEAAAVDVLTTYLRANLLEHMPKLTSPNRELSEGRMQIDSHTIKALEIREGMREGGVVGSLFSSIKRTVTSGGTRLLARWLCSPSTSLAEINARQSLVAFFFDRPHLRIDLVGFLQNIEDASRIVQKFLLGRGDASDLSAINSTIAAWSSLNERIQLEKTMEARERGEANHGEWSSLDMLMSRLDSLHELSNEIGMALQGVPSPEEAENINCTPDGVSNSTIEGQNVPFDDELKWQTGYKWTINPQFSEELSALHCKLAELFRAKERLEHHFQSTFNAPSLSLRSSLMHGLHVHIAKAKRHDGKIKASPDFLRISESNSTSCFFNQEWSQLGSQIAETSQTINATERQAFESLRDQVNTHEGILRRNARIIDELDVTLAFATLAAEMRFVKPTLTDDFSLHIVNGRHPTVELGLLTSGRVFTPNTISFSPDSRLHIITGPNMAGKSTLLRQTALIAILAQIGSFVPADSATIGIVDRLYSRVGAKDDLFRDRSTFMVEMLETSEILQRATPNSLVIMDEVGRGTTVKDGLAIAFATVHHLYSQNCCRALFATHFHELTDMLGYSSDHKGEGPFHMIGFFCTDVDETEDGRFAYSHRLKPGVNRDSHGLKVAQLAGMPKSAVAVARKALNWLKHDAGNAPALQARLKLLGQSLSSEMPSPDGQ